MSLSIARAPRSGGARDSESSSTGGAGLRAFTNIAEAWGLSVAEQLKLLGIASRSTFFKWRREREPRLPQDTLERLSYLLGIYKSLQILLPDPQRRGPVGAQAQRRAAVRRPFGARAHVVRPGGRPLRGAAVPRRRARLSASRGTTDGCHLVHRAGGEVRAVPSHRREPPADDSPVRARGGSGRLGRLVQARIHDESAHSQRDRRADAGAGRGPRQRSECLRGHGAVHASVAAGHAIHRRPFRRVLRRGIHRHRDRRDAFSSRKFPARHQPAAHRAGNALLSRRRRLRSARTARTAHGIAGRLRSGKLTWPRRS